VLESLVRYELLYQESKKKVRVTDAEIAAELEKLKSQFRTEADFTNAAPVLRVQVERALSIRKYIDATYASKAQVTDKEIRSSYDRNRDGFRVPEQVRANYVFVKIDPQWDEAGKAEAKRKIEDVRKKALAGEDFASLARTHSEDPTAKNGGDMGYVRQGQLLKAVEEALFALKPGEVSIIVETTVGYHLVKLVERKPETTLPFENVKDRLRAVLEQEKKQQEASAYIAKVREKAAVQTFLPEEE
jgi:peptidyl-prolyl cis-trans isomerase C